jgi:hypothetical protein
MNITAPCVVSLVWRLEDAQGNLIDELNDPVEFFYGGEDLLEKVEEALADQTIGCTWSPNMRSATTTPNWSFSRSARCSSSRSRSACSSTVCRPAP